MSKDPPDALHLPWKWAEDYDSGITITTTDGRLRVMRMFHSGFGVSTSDRVIAQQVVDAHNLKLETKT